MALLLAVGCGHETPPTEVPPGSWGGSHAEVTVTTGLATFQFDCAHGRVPGTIELDVDGHFREPGVYVLEHGGPVGPGPEDERPAVYEGRLTGSTLTFDVVLPQGPSPGTFTVVRGAAPRLTRCL